MQPAAYLDRHPTDALDLVAPVAVSVLSHSRRRRHQQQVAVVEFVEADEGFVGDAAAAVVEGLFAVAGNMAIEASSVEMPDADWASRPS